MKTKNITNNLKGVRDECRWHMENMKQEENAVLEVVFKGVAEDIDDIVRELEGIENK